MAEPGEKSASKGQAMQAYNRLLAQVAKGMAAEEVRAILGEPESILRRSEFRGPSETFAAFGLHYDFGEGDADEVWTFRDPYRPRRLDCYAFQSGRVCSAWRVVQEGASS